MLSWSIIIDNHPLFTDNNNRLSSSSYPIPGIGHVTTLQRPRCKSDGSPGGTSFEHSSRDPFVLLVADIRQLHQVRLVVEIPVFTMGFIYTSQVVIAGYLNHHHVSSMYLGKGLILICQPIKEGHFLIKVSLSKTTYDVSKVCPNVLDVKKYQTLGNGSQVSQSQQVRKLFFAQKQRWSDHCPSGWIRILFKADKKKRWNI